MATTAADRLTTEPAVVRRLVAELARHGFTVTGVHDGEEVEPATTAADVLRVLSDVELGTVRVTGPDGKRSGVLVVWQRPHGERVPGSEAVECISDYSVALDAVIDAVYTSYGA